MRHSAEPATELSDFDIPYLEHLLDELFAVPPRRLFPEFVQPLSIYDLAAHCARPVDQVASELVLIEQRSQAVYIAPDECLQVVETARQRAQSGRSAVIICDVRSSDDFFKRPLSIPGVLHLPTMMADTIEALRSQAANPLAPEQAVLVWGDDEQKSWSAAMWLRQQGVPARACPVHLLQL